MIHSPPDPASSPRDRLSAWMDGELQADDLTLDMDAQLMADWHCYQLLGDVLRANDLASAAPAESDLVLALRARLATEPVPATAAANEPLQDAAMPGRGRQSRWARAWSAPVAAAAGFMLVGSGVWVMQTGKAPSTAMQSPQAAASVPADVIRNARLDRYLHAHRAWAQGLAADAPTAQRIQVVHEVR